MILNKERFEKDTRYSGLKEKEVPLLEPKELVDVLSSPYVC
jgi:hypothetical protein